MKIGRRLTAFATATVLLTSMMVLGFVMVPSAKAQPLAEWHANVNGQLTCSAPLSCVTITLQAQASGPADSLNGRVVVAFEEGEPDQPLNLPCMASVTGTIQLDTNNMPTGVTLMGTLQAPGPTGTPAGQQCGPGLVGVPVSLVVSEGVITLISNSAIGGSETLASGTGTVIIQQPPGPSL